MQLEYQYHIEMSHSETYQIETYYYETVSKGEYMKYVHEMQLLAIKFLQLGLLKQLGLLIFVYITVLICSLFIQIGQFMYILSSF